MGQNDFAQAMAWRAASRLLVIGLLGMSALQTGFAAMIFGILGSSENDKIIAAGLWLFSGVSVAVAVGFRKLQEPTWKHWLVVGILATPGALTLALQ